MGRKGRRGNGYGLRTSQLPDYVAISLVDGNAALKVGESEGADTVSPIDCPDQRIQCLVITDRNDLTLADIPACRPKIETDCPHLANERIHRRHSCFEF